MTITLDKQEAIDILEEIAREAGNSAARIAAIRQLEEMRDAEADKPEAFGALDGPLIRTKQTA